MRLELGVGRRGGGVHGSLSAVGVSTESYAGGGQGEGALAASWWSPSSSRGVGRVQEDDLQRKRVVDDDVRWLAVVCCGE
jgi:hypothetical protein